MHPVTFIIEQRHLSDRGGMPVGERPGSVSFHTFEAETPDDVVRLFVEREEAELLGNIFKFPGFRAVATVRTAGGVYTLQVAPAAEQSPDSEELSTRS